MSTITTSSSSSSIKDFFVKTRRFVKVIFIYGDFGQPSVDILWDVFDDSRWMARFLIDVEGIVTRFCVGHVFTVSQVKGDVKEVYYFLVGLDSNPQTLANTLRNSFFMSSACRGDALVTPRPSPLYKPKLHALPNFSLMLWGM